MQGSQCFCLQVATPKAAGQLVSASPVSINLDRVPEEYHDFTDVFSKSKARVLADHCPYNLKITLEEGASPPLGPIYSLSQEKLLALHNFIDENTSTGFIHPSQSPHRVPILIIWKKDSSLCLCCDFWGINRVSKDLASSWAKEFVTDLDELHQHLQEHMAAAQLQYQGTAD